VEGVEEDGAEKRPKISFDPLETGAEGVTVVVVGAEFRKSKEEEGEEVGTVVEGTFEEGSNPKSNPKSVVVDVVVAVVDEGTAFVGLLDG
jgi:hypothetical protein